MAYDPALESIFANAEQQAAGLLETITAAINSKVTSIEAGEKLVLALSEEAAKFNQMLVDLDNIKSQIESGDMSKEDGLASVKPIVAELKANCQALQLSNAELSDSEDIDVAEIAVLREIIAGAKSAAEARVVELRTSGEEADATDAPAQGGVLESLMNLEVAEEGLFKPTKFGQLRKCTEAKTAATLKKNAKKLYSMGSKEKAQQYMKKAQDMYEKLAEKARKESKFFEVERTARTNSSVGKSNIGVEDKFKTKVTDNNQGLAVVTYFETLADSCKAYLLQWQNKAGKATLAETKAQLKAERKAERDRIRAEKKEAKAAKESFDVLEDLSDSDKAYVSALESYIDSIEVAEFTAAFESQDSDGDGEKTGLLAKFRAAFKRLRGGDEKGLDDMDSAVKETLSEADEAEKSKDPKRIRKVLLTIAGIIAAIAVIVVVANVLDKKFNNGQLGKKLSKIGSDIRAKLPGIKKSAGDDDAAAKGGILSGAKNFLKSIWDAIHSLLKKLPWTKQSQMNREKKRIAKDNENTLNRGGDVIEDHEGANAHAAYMAERGADESAGLSGILSLLCDHDSAPATESVDPEDPEDTDEAEEVVLESMVSIMMAEDGIEIDD